ncbi:pyridoxamine 5'-phosphate oxidase family protein [Nocardia aurantiaca]|uniref:Pyridoxamine 5'-phosphate oxidase family protein n=1 Tax=Nocardia aurantiaca TaxID=2675850 RepID=A0A6I3L290_9NOCA|nr:pyridoxamine 5'-phosphate oxidase family protein [Nocardia aurantiaca]MTE13979.1 pyridoxamine 5'-phosphate oxidase family protein [Nocardia aurantiaca]
MIADPVSAQDLNIYGKAELPWDVVRKAMDAGIGLPETAGFLGTVSPSGKPSSAGIGCVESGGHIYFTSGPGTKKSRNLTGNPYCTLSFRFPEIDLVLSGEAHRVTDAGEIDRVTAVFREGGWPAERSGDAVTAPYSAQSAGPAPWHLYRFAPHTAVALALTDPHGATRWQFAH